MLRSLILIPLLFFMSIGHAEDEVLSSFLLTSPNKTTLSALGKHFGLEHWRGNSVEIIVPKSQIPVLLSIAPSASLVDADTAASAQSRRLLFSMRSLFATDGYHSFDQVQEWMAAIAKAHPDMASVVRYGTSGKGRPLAALRLNKSSEKKPVLMITAATHGDELITTEVLMRLVDEVVAGQGSDSRFSQMLDSHDLYFVPVVNPDGFAATRRYDGNADPNRSYPWPNDKDNLPTPSIAGIIDLYNTIKPVGTLDYHAYGEMVMYPWAYTYDALPASFDAPMDKLTTSMAANNGYAHGQISRVIYIAQGSSCDYYFWKDKTTSVAIEMGSDKIPDPSEIPEYVQAQSESLWRFIESF